MHIHTCTIRYTYVVALHMQVFCLVSGHVYWLEVHGQLCDTYMLARTHTVVTKKEMNDVTGVHAYSDDPTMPFFCLV